jgi:hypothetical protein
MTFHAELSRSVSSRGAKTVPSAYPATDRNAAAHREPLYDALHACPTRRLLGWRMAVAAGGSPQAEDGFAAASANERS